jgi:hypothetical protein
MILVVVGGIYVAAYLPQMPSLAIPAVLLGLAALLLVLTLAALARIGEFAWPRFFQVGRWAFIAYVIIAGMLELVFALDGTPGTMLAFLTCMLAIFAVDVPLILAFSVARYEAPAAAV